jgi:hypothetical protein
VPTAAEYHLATSPTYAAAPPLWVQPSEDEVRPPTFAYQPAWAPGYFLGQDPDRKLSRRARRRVHRRERRVARRRGH